MHKWRVQNAACSKTGGRSSRDSPFARLSSQRAGGINFNPCYFLLNYEVHLLIAKPEFRLAPKAERRGCVWRITQE